MVVAIIPRYTLPSSDKDPGICLHLIFQLNKKSEKEKKKEARRGSRRVLNINLVCKERRRAASPPALLSALRLDSSHRGHPGSTPAGAARETLVKLILTLVLGLFLVLGGGSTHPTAPHE